MIDRIGIVLIALPEKTHLDYAPAVSYGIEKKADSIYLLAIGEDNIGIAKTVEAHFKNSRVVEFKSEVSYRVQFGNMRQPKDAICILFLPK